MTNIDYISEKWRPIRRIHRHGYIHLVSSVFPIVYVGVYAEAQRRSGDWKECGAALAALFFNVMHLMRTTTGIIQANAFLKWCERTVECMNALLEAMYEQYREEGTLWKMRDGFRGEVEGTVDRQVMANNTVIDNELGGTDITVKVLWGKMWKGLKRGEFRPSEWLGTDQGRLCTVRWCSAFLCGVGGDWTVGYVWYNGDAMDGLKTFFSHDLRRSRQVLNKVTWNFSNDDCNCEIFNIGELTKEQSDTMSRAGDSSDSPLAYASTAKCRLNNRNEFKSFAFDFDSLASSYPCIGESWEVGNREKIGVELVQPVLVAKHIGLDRLKTIGRYYMQYRLPTDQVQTAAMSVLLKQTTARFSSEHKICTEFGEDRRLPRFPYEMEMVALWEQGTNWRVFQASVHSDIKRSLDQCRYGDWAVPLFQVEPEPTDIFEYCREHAIEFIECSWNPLGVVLETVRTCLAKWFTVTTGSAWEPEWEPEIPLHRFEFISNWKREDYNDYDDMQEVLIWRCQCALQQEIFRMQETDENLPGNKATIMLFMLGLPCLKFEEVGNAEQEDEEHAQNTGKSNTSNSTEYSADLGVNVSVEVFRVWSPLAPQNISLMIRRDRETGEISLWLKNNSESAGFRWQKWVDAAMGCLRGMEECENEDAVKYERTIVREDLREPIVEMCPLLFGDDDSIIETGTARMWVGWPAFDGNICQFEVEEMMASCNMYWGRRCRISEEKKWDLSSRIEDVKKLLKSVVVVEKGHLDSEAEVVLIDEEVR